MNLWSACFFMLILIPIWAILYQHFKKKRWAAINAVIFSLSTVVILYATILGRTPGDYAWILGLT